MSDGEVVESTALQLVRGDADNYLITVDDGGDPAVAVDLSLTVDGLSDGLAIVRFAVVKNHRGTSNAAALIFKTTYREDEILLANQNTDTGKFTVFIDKDDTDGEKVGTYCWDVEVTLQDFEREGSTVGTASVAEDGATTIIGVGTDFTHFKKGDVLTFIGGSNANVPCMIVSVADATHLVIDNDQLEADDDVVFTVRRGLSRTVARGTFELVDESVL